MSLDQAGIYENPEEGYHINEENKAVEYEKVKALCLPMEYDKQVKMRLVNNSTILRRLGINL
jgi:hypothetical protein